MSSPVTAPLTTVKSNVITNLDASPLVRPSAGGGAAALVHRQIATITPAASQATSVLDRMCRIPSNAVGVRVYLLWDAATTTSTTNVGLWYSDSTTDGTSVINQGNLTAISSAFFASVIAMATFAAVPGTDPSNTIGLGGGFIEVTFMNSGGAFTDGQYLPSQLGNPIWLAVANSLALQTTPVGAFTSAAIAPHFQTASAGGSVYVRSDDPGGYFDVCLQFTSTGSSANQKVTMMVEYN